MSYIEDTEYSARLIVTDQEWKAVQDYHVKGGPVVITQLVPRAQEWCERIGHTGKVTRVNYSLGASTDPDHRRCWYYYMDFATERDAILFKTWFV
jgi:hypothetical protein